MRRAMGVAMVAWAVLTGVGAAALLATFSFSASDPPMLARMVTGLTHVMLAPGWVAAAMALGRWPTHSVPGVIAASGIGAACVVAGAMALWIVRHRLVHGRWPWAGWRDARGRGRRGVRGAEEMPTPSAAPMSDGGARGPRACGVDLSRRRVLIDGSIAVGTLAGSAALVRATMVEPWSLRVERCTVAVRGLPAALEGLRLAHVSDTHLGPRVPTAFVRRAIEAALRLEPDVFVLTGDYIHGGVERIAEAAGMFGPLVATGRPVLAVLGNHDWYGHGPLMARALADVGVRVLDHGRVLLDARTRSIVAGPDLERTLERALERGGAEGMGLVLAGLGDLMEDHLDVDRALGGVPEDVPRVVLSHHPDAAEYIALGRVPMPERRDGLPRLVDASRGSRRMDVMLCGHTHGGQVSLPLVGAPVVPSSFGQKYAGGVCRGPQCPVVVSRGVGMSILPVRLNVPPEIGEVRLVGV